MFLFEYFNHYSAVNVYGSCESDVGRQHLDFGSFLENFATMADRKAELERKKARLEQMRKERKEKELSKKGKEVIFAILRRTAGFSIIYQTYKGLSVQSC